MDYAEYEAVQAVRWSVLKEMRRSPKHYQYRLTHPREDTPFFRLGRAVHTAVLEPDLFPATVAVFGGKVRRGKEWDAFETENEGRTILKRDEMAMCLGIRDSVRAHPVARHLLEYGEAEKTIVWKDPRTGLTCKGRIDWLNSMLCDLKTDGQLDPRRFANSVVRYGYHCQLASYREGLRANGIDAPVKFMVVESDPPYDVGVFSLDEDALYAGEEELHRLMDRVVECAASGKWPGMFGEGECPLVLPPWAFGPEESEGATVTELAGEG
jgi:hypothetical protein